MAELKRKLQNTASHRSPTRNQHRLLMSLEELGVYHPDQAPVGFDNAAARADERRTALTARHQQNLERIIALALERSEQVTSFSQPEPDWLEHYLSLAESTSNLRMQELWARVLLAESQQPGSFSVRTLRLLAELTPYEATLLRRAKALTALERGTGRYKIILGYYHKPTLWRWLTLTRPNQLNLARSGLTYPDVLTLGELGILHQDAIESGPLPSGRSLQLTWGAHRLQMTPKEPGLILSYLKYTRLGEELCRLIPTTIQADYKEQLEQAFKLNFLLQSEFD
ncbi:MAG: TIGR03899 family protein [Idiomarina sp.]|nr:TIGR03899 family protein [Idiomarina sp.]